MTWPHDVVLHAWWVEPGRLLAGEYPASSSAAKTAEKVQLLVDAGVESIIDLTTPADGLESYQAPLDAAAANAGRTVRRFTHPIPDNHVIDHDGYDSIVGLIREEMAAERIVYVHCWGGRGRTSTVVGCLLIDDGPYANRHIGLGHVLMDGVGSETGEVHIVAGDHHLRLIGL